MGLTCGHSDQDLLLGLHGELGPIARARLALRLRHCPRCLARHREFQQITGLLGSVLMSGVGPMQVAGPFPWYKQPVQLTWRVAALMALLMSGVGAGAIYLWNASQKPDCSHEEVVGERRRITPNVPTGPRAKQVVVINPGAIVRPDGTMVSPCGTPIPNPR